MQVDCRAGSFVTASLESAIARAENKVNYDSDATVPTVAASLAWGLIKNHAFIDGNKRIGLPTRRDPPDNRRRAFEPRVAWQ
jgi:hypothetical protein